MKRAYVLLMVLIIMVQCMVMGSYWKRETADPQREANQLLWSTVAGAADGRLTIDATNSLVQQHFANQHQRLNGMFLFFYHCDVADSGQVYVRIKDLEGVAYYEYCFEPLHMENDVFCLFAGLEEGVLLDENTEYILEISVENMDAEDYLEVGTTLSPSKPSIFLEMEDGNTLFTSLDYTYTDMRDVEKGIEHTLKVCLVIDGVLILVGLGLVWKRRKVALLLLAVSVATVVGEAAYNHYVESHKWFRENSYVVHAFGEVDGKVYLNALEAFEASYQGGHRVFEVDFAMTSDNRIVLKHDWENAHGLPQFENGTIPTLEEFKTAKIWGKYTTMDIEDLLQLMLEYPDIYIVTDSKSGVYKDSVDQFTQIVDILNGFTERERKSIMKRLIVQLYNDDMYEGMEKIAHFENYIYTLYQRGVANPEQLGEFCVDNDIPVIVIPSSWWTKEINDTLQGYGLEVWVHTLNENEEIEALRDQGVDGIYTDVTDLDELVIFN